jgi:hypothetical protein
MLIEFTATCDKFINYLKKSELKLTVILNNFGDNVTELRVYCELLTNVNKQCDQIITLLNNNQVTTNFELVDITLQRYLQQLNLMFPNIKPITDPCSLIIDVNARDIWKKEIGENVLRTSFDIFHDKIILKYFSDVYTDSLFLGYLRFFINFPKDNIINIVKWNQLTLVFGFETFYEEFKLLTNNNGFIGLVSAVTATNIIYNHPPLSYLIRWSRLQPDVFSITYKKQNNECLNYRMEKKPDGTVEKLSTVLKTKFSEYKPIEKKLSTEAIEKTNLVEYAKKSKTYY